LLARIVPASRRGLIARSKLSAVEMLSSGLPVGLLALRRRFRGYPVTE
jgi:hypothetical protein